MVTNYEYYIVASAFGSQGQRTPCRVVGRLNSSTVKFTTTAACGTFGYT